MDESGSEKTVMLVERLHLGVRQTWVAAYKLCGSQSILLDPEGDTIYLLWKGRRLPATLLRRASLV